MSCNLLMWRVTWYTINFNRWQRFQKHLIVHHNSLYEDKKYAYVQ